MKDSLSSELALSIIENCTFPLLVMDKDGRVAGFNRTFAQLVGDESADKLKGRACDDIGEHPLRVLLAGENTLCWTDPSDRQHQFEVRLINLPDQHDCQVRVYIDISRQIELQRAHDALNDELKKHVLTDDATGLLNKRGIALALEPQVARSRRYNSPISVVMMGVHKADSSQVALRQIARLLKDQLRWADLIGYSDDAFILVLPETTAEASMRLADKLKRKLDEMLDRELQGRSIDSCYGVTAWRRSDNAGTLMNRAAMALSQARSAQGEQLIAL